MGEEDAEAQLFMTSLQKLMQGAVKVEGFKHKELQACLESWLVKDPAQRTQSAAEALRQLDEAWTVVEARTLEEVKAASAQEKALDRARRANQHSKKEDNRLVLE